MTEEQIGRSLGMPAGRNERQKKKNEIAPIFQTDFEEVIRRQDIEYLQPAVRNADYLPLGNGDVGMQADPFGSQGMGGWINKTDIWLERHNHPENPLTGFGTLKEWHNARSEGEAALKKLLEREVAENDHFPSQNIRPRVGGRVSSVLSVDDEVLQHVTSPAVKERVADYRQRLNLYDAACDTEFSWSGKSRTKAHSYVHSGKNVTVMRFQDHAEPGRQVCRRINLERYRWEKGKWSRGWEGREEFSIRGDRESQAIVIEYSNVSGLRYSLACTAIGEGVRLEVDPDKSVNEPVYEYTTFGKSWLEGESPAAIREQCLSWAVVQGNAVFVTDPAVELDITVLTAIVTSEESEDPTVSALALLNEARRANPEQLEAEHREWWHRFWTYSFIEVDDPDFEAYWYVQNYLTASSSRGRHAPPICQLWQQQADWPWQGGFWDFNTPAMYVSVQSTNHPELGYPFWRTVQRAMPGFRANARELYGARGICMPASYGHEGYEIAPAYWRFRYFNTFLTAILQYWRYLFSLDETLLSHEVYPFLKESCMFYEDFLEWRDDQQSYSVPVPSCSLNEDGSENSWKVRNDAFDVAGIRRLFHCAVEASERLDVDVEDRKRWQELLTKLAPVPSDGMVFTINETGVMEGLVHTNLATMFPMAVVDPQDPRAVATVLAQDDLGMGRQCFTGQMWAASAAWVERPDALTRALHRWFQRHVFPHGMIGEGEVMEIPEYGRSAVTTLINESGPWAQAAITEGLCRSLYDGIIRVFSAPPLGKDNRPGTARFAGVRTVNAFLVASERLIDPEGRPAVPFIGIQSLAGTVCRVALPDWGEATVEQVDPVTCESFGPVAAETDAGIVSFPTEAERAYLLYPAGERPERLWDGWWEHRPRRPREYIGLPERKETTSPTQGIA